MCSSRKYLLGGYAVFGALGAAIFGIGVGVALDRNAGWLELKQATPMPPLAYVLSKACMAMVFGLIIVSILTVLGISFGHVHITLSEFARIAGLAAAGAIPFSSARPGHGSAGAPGFRERHRQHGVPADELSFRPVGAHCNFYRMRCRSSRPPFRHTIWRSSCTQHWVRLRRERCSAMCWDSSDSRWLRWA